MENKYMIAGFILLIFLIGVLLYTVFNTDKKIEEINDKEIEKIQEEPINFDFDVATIEKKDILGTWNSISEQTIDGDFQVNGFIKFNEDGSYIVNEEGVEETGFYVLDGEKITFYDSKEDIGKEGRFNGGLIGIEEGKLKIFYELYPKVVVYQR